VKPRDYQIYCAKQANKADRGSILSNCALGAGLKQGQEDGLRYRRALYRYLLCRAPSDREFCSAHGNFSWGDSESLKKMAEQVYERCGTVNSFYVKEPATGEAPPALLQPFRRSPCEGL